MRASLLLISLLLMSTGCGRVADSPSPDKDVAPAVIAADTPATAAPIGGEPQAAQRPPQELLVRNGVNYACRTDTDCEVKDIGNCCGSYPACVNKDSPTFADQVKAQCASEGQMSVCGYEDVTGCSCIEGRCTNITGVASGASLQ